MDRADQLRSVLVPALASSNMLLIADTQEGFVVNTAATALYTGSGKPVGVIGANFSQARFLPYISTMLVITTAINTRSNHLIVIRTTPCHRHHCHFQYHDHRPSVPLGNLRRLQMQGPGTYRREF